MKATIYLRIDDGDRTDRRVVEYVPAPEDWMVKPEVRALADAYYIGETAKGMAADMLGGLAATAFSSPASRARRAASSDTGGRG